MKSSLAPLTIEVKPVRELGLEVYHIIINGVHVNTMLNERHAMRKVAAYQAKYESLVRSSAAQKAQRAS